MPIEEAAATWPRPRADKGPRSDRRSIPSGQAYGLALRFNPKRKGLAAFDWVAMWRTSKGTGTRAFPLDAHGFAEALQGAATTILIETGYPVPAAELEIAGYKERRVNEYLREQALQEATALAALPSGPAAASGTPSACDTAAAWLFRTI